MAKKQKYILYIAGAIVALAVLNLLIFSGALNLQKGVSCYKNVCFHGQKDPIAELNALEHNYSKLILYWEGDYNYSKTNVLIATAFAQLAQDHGQKPIQLVAAGMQNKTTVSCTCQERTNNDTFGNCSQSIKYCQSLQPQGNEFMISLKYPGYSKDEIIISGRTIEFHAKTSGDLYAEVLIYRELRR